MNAPKTESPLKACPITGKIVRLPVACYAIKDDAHVSKNNRKWILKTNAVEENEKFYADCVEVEYT